MNKLFVVLFVLGFCLPLFSQSPEFNPADLYEIAEAEAKASLGKILEELDHAYLNDLPAFQKCNPTSENLARYIFERLEKELGGSPARVCAVEICESDRSSVVYSHA